MLHVFLFTVCDSRHKTSEAVAETRSEKMHTSSKKKPTHCDQYGHTWEASTIVGYERCSHVSYSKNGKPISCAAARRIGTPTPSSEPVTSRPCSAQPVVDQVSLWG